MFVCPNCKAQIAYHNFSSIDTGKALCEVCDTWGYPEYTDDSPSPFSG